MRAHGGDRVMRGLLAVTAFVAALGMVGCNDDDPAGPEATVEQQRAYIDAIVPHHEVALIRADEALAKAQHQWLRDMATEMKADQAGEIALFRDRRQNILGSDSTPPPMMPQPIPAGTDFDRMWMEDMIAHHQGAIDQSTLALAAGVPQPLDSLARHTIEEQRREQSMLRDSLAVWFP